MHCKKTKLFLHFGFFKRIKLLLFTEMEPDIPLMLNI